MTSAALAPQPAAPSTTPPRFVVREYGDDPAAPRAQIAAAVAARLGDSAAAELRAGWAEHDAELKAKLRARYREWRAYLLGEPLPVPPELRAAVADVFGEELAGKIGLRKPPRGRRRLIAELRLRAMLRALKAGG